VRSSVGLDRWPCLVLLYDGFVTLVPASDCGCRPPRDALCQIGVLISGLFYNRDLADAIKLLQFLRVARHIPRGNLAGVRLPLSTSTLSWQL
jgi:hypothetical protein